MRRGLGAYAVILFFMVMGDMLAMGDDFGNIIATAYPISINSVTPDDIETSFDIDFFKITASAGTLTIYTIGSSDTAGAHPARRSVTATAAGSGSDSGGSVGGPTSPSGGDP